MRHGCFGVAPLSPCVRRPGRASLFLRRAGGFMPDGKTHKYVGAGAGAAFAYYRANHLAAPNWLPEVVGGAVGGYVGGTVPDAIEPAISSWHRGLAHSCAAGGAIICIKDPLSGMVAACRENAEKCRAIRMEPQGAAFVAVPATPLAQLLSGIAEFFWRFLAGFLNGLAAGYVSHLALDALTPRSVPLLTNGF